MSASWDETTTDWRLWEEELARKDVYDWTRDEGSGLVLDKPSSAGVLGAILKLGALEAVALLGLVLATLLIGRFL